MPQLTFLNLSEERQKKILEVCFKEFALNEYKVASIGNIIKELNIAKGSFYRYFENKRDLYFYLIDEAGKTRFREIDILFADPKKDFFQLIIENFAFKIQYDLENPLPSGFLYNVMQEKNNEEIGNIQIETKKRILNIIMELLNRNETIHQVRTDIPLFDMAYSILQMQWGMYDYLELKHSVDFRENIKAGKAVFSISKEDILKDVSSFVEILKSGMQSRSI